MISVIRRSFRDRNVSLLSVLQASSFRLYARRDGSPLTKRGESGVEGESRHAPRYAMNAHPTSGCKADRDRHADAAGALGLAWAAGAGRKTAAGEECGETEQEQGGGEVQPAQAHAHGEHGGAWPTDSYYADMDGDWTDNGLNVGCVEAAVMSGLLAANGRQRGALQGGGRINMQKAAEVVIHEFRAATMGRITLETPQEFAQWVATGQQLDAERLAQKEAKAAARKGKRAEET